MSSVWLWHFYICPVTSSWNPPCGSGSHILTFVSASMVTFLSLSPSGLFVLIMTVQNFCLGAMKEFFLHNRGLEERFFQICWWEKNKKGICCNVITFFLCVMASVWSEKTVSTVGSQFCLSRLNHNAEQRTMCCHICSLFSAAATLLLQTTINHILM